MEENLLSRMLFAQSKSTGFLMENIYVKMYVANIIWKDSIYRSHFQGL